MMIIIPIYDLPIEITDGIEYLITKALSDGKYPIIVSLKAKIILEDQTCNIPYLVTL